MLVVRENLSQNLTAKPLKGKTAKFAESIFKPCVQLLHRKYFKNEYVFIVPATNRDSLLISLENQTPGKKLISIESLLIERAQCKKFDYTVFFSCFSTRKLKLATDLMSERWMF